LSIFTTVPDFIDDTIPTANALNDLFQNGNALNDLPVRYVRRANATKDIRGTEYISLLSNPDVELTVTTHGGLLVVFYAFTYVVLVHSALRAFHIGVDINGLVTDMFVSDAANTTTIKRHQTLSGFLTLSLAPGEHTLKLVGKYSGTDTPDPAITIDANSNPLVFGAWEIPYGSKVL